MLNVPAYVLSKKYTDDSLIGMGALKGAPCKIKSIVKENGENIITFEWLDNDGGTHESILKVEDGTPIYTWTGSTRYEYGDLVIYEASFYRCTTPNSDSTFNPAHWAPIGSPDGAYGLVNIKSELPIRFTTADRRLYYVIDEGIFYLWDGTKWEPQRISDEDIDNLFI